MAFPGGCVADLMLTFLMNRQTVLGPVLAVPGALSIEEAAVIVKSGALGSSGP